MEIYTGAQKCREQISKTEQSMSYATRCKQRGPIHHRIAPWKPPAALSYQDDPLGNSVTVNNYLCNQCKDHSNDSSSSESFSNDDDQSHPSKKSKDNSPPHNPNDDAPGSPPHDPNDDAPSALPGNADDVSHPAKKTTFNSLPQDEAGLLDSTGCDDDLSDDHSLATQNF